MIQQYECKGFENTTENINDIAQAANLSVALWESLPTLQNKAFQDLQKDSSAYSNLPEMILSDPSDNTVFCSNAKAENDNIIKEFKGKGPLNDPLTEYTVKVYGWKESGDKATGSATIIDANGLQTDIAMSKVGKDGNSIDSATMTYEGTKVGELTSTHYKYLHQGQWKKIEIEGSSLKEDGIIEIKTKDNTKILLRPDGSKVEEDAAGRPLLVDDANGNRIEYKWKKWPNGEDKLDYVSMQGPMTNNELIEYKLSLQYSPGKPPQLLPPSCQHTYAVYVKGVHQGSAISLGAGAGAGLQYGPASGGVSVGASAPIGKTVRLYSNGPILTIKQDSEVVSGIFQGEVTSHTLFPDGTTFQNNTTGWLMKDYEMISLDKQGKKRIKGR
jgi:hypothetical protein